MFQKSSAAKASERVCVWLRVNPLVDGKLLVAHKERFLLLPQCFQLSYVRNYHVFAKAFLNSSDADFVYVGKS